MEGRCRNNDRELNTRNNVKPQTEKNREDFDVRKGGG
jgi:hypothetical protein